MQTKRTPSNKIERKNLCVGIALSTPDGHVDRRARSTSGEHRRSTTWNPEIDLVRYAELQSSGAHRFEPPGAVLDGVRGAPRGVTPTARAHQLVLPITDILARVHGVIAGAQPFDAATSKRRFAIALLEGTAEVLFVALLEDLERSAPGIDLSLHLVLPPVRGSTTNTAWLPIPDDLESGADDIAVLPTVDLPVRFEVRQRYEDDFVVTMRRGHPFARRPTLKSYCKLRHVVVSRTGDSYGRVDALLAQRGLTRHVSVTVPSFMTALSVLAGTDRVSALPRGLVTRHAHRFDLVSASLPLKRPRESICPIATKSAMADPGVAFVFEALVRAARSGS